MTKAAHHTAAGVTVRSSAGLGAGCSFVGGNSYHLEEGISVAERAVGGIVVVCSGSLVVEHCSAQLLGD